MRNPAAFAVERPRVILLATALALTYGTLSYVDLPRQENPTLRDRFAAVQTYLPGAEPEKIELLLTKVIEDKIAEVDDIHTIFSSSVDGASFVRAELKKGAPFEERLQQIRDKVQEARVLFPAGATEPEVDTRVLRTNTMILAVTGQDLPPLALREHAKRLERHLESLPDVGRVTLLGEPEEEIEVAIDLHDLSQRGISLTAVVDGLARRNVLLPGGEIEVGGLRSPIQTTGAYDGLAEIRATYLGAGESALPVRLADVAQVRRRFVEDAVAVRWKGIPAISLALEMLPGRNAIAVGDRVRALIAASEPMMPDGVSIRVVADEPRYVQERLDRLSSSLLLGLGLVIALTFLGLGWRSGLIASLSIPLSLTVGMGLIALFGVPLHQISIAALVIAIGLVVDEAIVVVDNIQRHLERGVLPKEAAIRGLGEIHLAILAGAATTVAAFVPLMLMQGDVGDFIRSIPLVVSLMLVGSVTVAHFVTPLVTAFLHGWSRPGGAVERPEIHRFEPHYRRLLDRVTRHTGFVLTLFAAAFLSSLVASRVALWPPDFFSDADRNQFLVELHLRPGAPLRETDAMMRSVEARLAEDPSLSDWTAFVGAGVPKFYYNQFTEIRGQNVGMLVVNTDPSIPFYRTREIATRLDHELKAALAGAFVRATPLRQGYGGGHDIEIFIEGDELPVLRSLAVRVRDIVEAVPGVTHARESFGYDPLTIEARIDPAMANVLGIGHRDVATTLRTAVDGVTATTFREGDEEIDIVVRLAEGQRRDVRDLKALPVHSPSSGGAVPLSHVAELVPGFATRSILRWKRRRETFVSADVAGRPLLAAAGDVERRVREGVALPPGYDISFWGQPREATESLLSLARAGIVAVFLIYIILVVRFHSLSQPLLIILAIPMSLIGSTWGLVLTGNPLSFTAVLGMISLTGIVVNDSIILMDYINTLRARGRGLEEAVVTGATTRLRAITLTSVTTMGGLLPLSLTGGEFFAPFGFAMIGGLAASTLLTLLVQPAAYLTLERRLQRARVEADPAKALPTRTGGRTGAP